MPHRQVRTALAALAFCVVASPVSAQWSEDSRSFASRSGFGASGHLAISAERVFGFVSSTSTTESGMTEESFNTQVIGFLSRGQVASPYNSPHFGLDYFVADGVSVGGSLGYVTSSFENESTTGGTTISSDGDLTSTFALNLRGGYAHMFSRSAGIWPRLGFTYFTGSDNDGNTDFNGFAVGLEAVFVLSPVDHLAFTLGPSFDIGLSGSRETDIGPTTVEEDMTITDIAVTVGLLGWL